ncbi:RNA-binding S4 domain-containing protein [Pediococcus claussenii]|uniref:RQC P-site tRNA stabilizing factor n=1 Tax=Pediococcus claussenii (strain ATCC BAA-344 / DSM 14800 / JCM 18046 / KCTC 3811 / LMG 21948 / P06) TaxID=701521 RepID=G8PAN2_PEDCP|nr:RNA-binding S4 domain-containing protein [Pediococcus claussenii]AEV94591.1 S4 domain protein [Pediococcus claussenii ATCC BAA-344]ANZ69800.1 hypothetical protein AYR57_05480 [Pediococcus claussenii]ANZ71617.1 hypothetical protein AYR58_05485 [Pediococcus claussenii]KRN19703.1 hypothetical protein IV79_GL000990 [Pediococcus claussenii]
MRLDKFLKVSRIIKRRTLAKEVADQGRILINDKVAKSSSNLMNGDTVEIRFGNKTLVIKVEQLLDTTKKEDAERMYSIVEEKYVHDFRE